jgi:hypothetical protein
LRTPVCLLESLGRRAAGDSVGLKKLLDTIVHMFPFYVPLLKSQHFAIMSAAINIRVDNISMLLFKLTLPFQVKTSPN